MFNLIKADLFKLSKDKPFRVVGIILLVVNFFSVGIFKLMQYMLNGVSSSLDEAVIMGMQSFTLISLFSLGSLGLFIIIMISMFTGKDFSQNTMRAKITSGNSRLKIFTSLLVVNLIIGFIMFFITTIEGLLLALIFYGKIAEFGAIIANILMCVPLYVCFIFVATFICFITKSQMLGLVFNILIVVALPSILSLVQAVSGVVSSDSPVLDFIFSIIPYAQINIVTGGQFFSYLIGAEGADISYIFIIKSVVCSAVLAILAFTAGFFAFKRADIK